MYFTAGAVCAVQNWTRTKIFKTQTVFFKYSCDYFGSLDNFHFFFSLQSDCGRRMIREPVAAGKARFGGTCLNWVVPSAGMYVRLRVSV